LIPRLSLLAPVLGGTPAAADREVLAEALQGVQGTPLPPEASYLRDLSTTFWNAVGSLLARGIERLDLPRWLVIGFVVLLVAVLLAVLVRLVFFLWRSRRGSAPRPEEGEDVRRVAALPARETDWDAAAWRAELDRCLAEGRVAEGLRAAWWWMARSVAGERVEPDWTSRDLVARSGRYELRDVARGLDTLIYGPERPGLDDLRRLVGRMEAALA
jgi:hypothetical protein